MTANYQRVARKLGITIIDEDAAAFYKEVVLETIKHCENQIHRNDFMSVLINMMKNEANPMTFNEIWAQSVIFFFAGFKTSATKITFCLYELALHKKIQRKVRES